MNEQIHSDLIKLINQSKQMETEIDQQKSLNANLILDNAALNSVNLELLSGQDNLKAANNELISVNANLIADNNSLALSNNQLTSANAELTSNKNFLT